MYEQFSKQTTWLHHRLKIFLTIENSNETYKHIQTQQRYQSYKKQLALSQVVVISVIIRLLLLRNGYERKRKTTQRVLYDVLYMICLCCLLLVPVVCYDIWYQHKQWQHFGMKCSRIAWMLLCYMCYVMIAVCSFLVMCPRILWILLLAYVERYQYQMLDIQRISNVQKNG